MFTWDHAILTTAGIIVGMTAREIPKIVLEKVLLRKKEDPQPVLQAPPVNGNGLSYASRRDVREELENTLRADVIPLIQGQNKILEALANGHLDMVRATTEVATMLRERR